MTDLLGGQVDMMCDQTTNTTGQIKSGKIKAYAVTTASGWPPCPTCRPWTRPACRLRGDGLARLYAPKGTPQPVIDKLAAALQAALQDPKVVERFADLGTEPVAQERATPAALEQQLQAEIVKWKPMIQAAGEYAD